MQLVCVQADVGVPTGVGKVDLYIDSETGVEYFVYANRSMGCAISPRVNPDGSPYTDLALLKKVQAFAAGQENDMTATEG